MEIQASESAAPSGEIKGRCRWSKHIASLLATRTIASVEWDTLVYPLSTISIRTCQQHVDTVDLTLSGDGARALWTHLRSLCRVGCAQRDYAHAPAVASHLNQSDHLPSSVRRRELSSRKFICLQLSICASGSRSRSAARPLYRSLGNGERVVLHLHALARADTLPESAS